MKSITENFFPVLCFATIERTITVVVVTIKARLIWYCTEAHHAKKLTANNLRNSDYISSCIKMIGFVEKNLLPKTKLRFVFGDLFAKLN